MSGIGGTNAFVNPLLGSATVFFVINFLYTMATILIFKYRKAYHQENIAFLQYSKKLLKTRVVDQKSDAFKKIYRRTKMFIVHEKDLLKKMETIDLVSVDHTMKKKPENAGEMENRKEFYTDDLQDLLLRISHMVEYTYLRLDTMRDPKAPMEDTSSEELEDGDDNVFEGGRV